MCSDGRTDGPAQKQSTLYPFNNKWKWAGNITLIDHSSTHDTARKRLIMRTPQESKGTLSVKQSALFRSRMIAKVERKLKTTPQNNSESLQMNKTCFKPTSTIFLLTVPRRYFFCGSFVLFMSCVCHAFAPVHCCLVVTWRERADLLALVCDVYWFYYFPIWYPGTDVVPDCIFSWSLLSFLLSFSKLSLCPSDICWNLFLKY